MLRIYNTLTRRKEVFTPRSPPVVKFFSCGPSIYQRPHLGNYRTFLYEDLLQRYLEYRGFRVERVLPFTDVEDKAIAQAKKEGLGLAALADRVAGEFWRDADLLRIERPAHNPRSSTTVGHAASIIEGLLAKGIAYRYGPDIYFDPLQYAGFGKLFRIDMGRWPKGKRRFRKDTYPGNRWNYGDFILWHGEREGDTAAWATALGRGRPAWNVQDPGMVIPFLGPEIDIHAGGVDNLYRHHDYIIAVIESLTGRQYARYWVHGEHLLLEGKKMSKSKGNIVYLPDLTSRGYTPEEVRFFLIYGHYRDRMNLTRERFDSAAKRIRDLRELVRQISESRGSRPAHGADAPPLVRSLEAGFEERMDDDLDVKGAFDHVAATVRDLAAMSARGDLPARETGMVVESLRRIDSVLQVIFPVDLSKEGS